MTDSLITFPLRVGLRAARASLLAARDLAELGLTTVEVIERSLGHEAPIQSTATEPVEHVERVADDVVEEAVPETPAHLPDDRELVDAVADPGAEDGAGASLRVAPPFDGYDELRAADVIARLGGADVAELGETELYERTHRGRRTVLDAIARELRRRPPRP